MKKQLGYKLAALMCVLVILFSGCGKSDEEEAKAEMIEMQVRAAFSEKQLENQERGMRRRQREKERKQKDGILGEAEIETEIETETKTETEVAQETEESTETEQKTEIEEEDGAITATAEMYDYVALGNSVTCNEPTADIWWGNWGMAATTADKDYVHLLSSWLGEQSDKLVTTTVLDFKKWETSKKRTEVLQEYGKYFNEYTDLITIQTGENITEFKDTLGQDCLDLVSYVKEKAPNAQILILGELLWPAEDIEAAKMAACQQYGVTFVGMEEFLKDYETFYRSAMGAEVSGEDGNTHAIVNEAVAAHPNNDGMKCIAQQIEKHIKITN